MHVIWHSASPRSSTRCASPAAWKPGSESRLCTQNVRTFIAECASLKIWVYRWEEIRRALIRERTAENNAPAPPTSASTTVGFSGESVQPVCPYSGAATSTITAHPRNTTVDFFISLPLVQSRLLRRSCLCAGHGRVPRSEEH